MLSILHFPEQNEEEGQDEQPFPFFLSFTIERIARREMRIKIAKTIKVPMFIYSPNVPVLAITNHT